MKLAHFTDIHLDHVERYGDDVVTLTRAAMASCQTADLVLVTGDIGALRTFPDMLEAFAEGCGRPIAFVLGNHDAWGGSWADAARAAVRLSRETHPYPITYLPTAGVVKLTDRTALCGVDGWYDGRAGDAEASDMFLNDWGRVDDLRDAVRNGELLRVLGKRAERDARVATMVLRAALDRFDHVVFATHVPPWPRASVNGSTGSPSSARSLPWYCNLTMGEAIERVAADHPTKAITVLCGHCHGAADVAIADNLRVVTGCADYGEVMLAGEHEIS